MLVTFSAKVEGKKYQDHAFGHNHRRNRQEISEAHVEHDSMESLRQAKITSDFVCEDSDTYQSRHSKSDDRPNN